MISNLNFVTSFKVYSEELLSEATYFGFDKKHFWRHESSSDRLSKRFQKLLLNLESQKQLLGSFAKQAPSPNKDGKEEPIRLFLSRRVVDGEVSDQWNQVNGHNPDENNKQNRKKS